MINNLTIEVPSLTEKPFKYEPKPYLSKKEGMENNLKVSNKRLEISKNVVNPQIQFPIYYRIEVDKKSELYRQLPKSIKTRLPITVWSSHPIYSHWVAKYGVFFEPSNKSDYEPIGLNTYLVDSTTGKEFLIDCFEKPDSEILTNLQQELKLFKQHGFGQKLRTMKVRIKGRTYQIIDDSVIHLDACPDLTISCNE